MVVHIRRRVDAPAPPSEAGSISSSVSKMRQAALSDSPLAEIIYRHGPAGQVEGFGRADR